MYTPPIRNFANVVLPCFVIRNQNLKSDHGMNQPTAQFLTATHPHSKLAVTHSKQSQVTFSNRNIKPCVATRNIVSAGAAMPIHFPIFIFNFPGFAR
jgi:hypothetical protein